jgi:hypothetical protein
MKNKVRFPDHRRIEEAMVKPVPMVAMLVHLHDQLGQGNTVMVPIRDEGGKHSFQPLEIV